MPARDPMTFPKGRTAFPTMGASLKHSNKRPAVGLTQGGSSRKGGPAKVAATNGLQPSKRK